LSHDRQKAGIHNAHGAKGKPKRAPMSSGEELPALEKAANWPSGVALEIWKRCGCAAKGHRVRKDSGKSVLHTESEHTPNETKISDRRSMARDVRKHGS
jgi:hypothetical protein